MRGRAAKAARGGPTRPSSVGSARPITFTEADVHAGAIAPDVVRVVLVRFREPVPGPMARHGFSAFPGRPTSLVSKGTGEAFVGRPAVRARLPFFSRFERLWFREKNARG